MRSRLLVLGLTVGTLLALAPAADALTIPPLCVKHTPLQLGYCPA